MGLIQRLVVSNVIETHHRFRLITSHIIESRTFRFYRECNSTELNSCASNFGFVLLHGGNLSFTMIDVIRSHQGLHP